METSDEDDRENTFERLCPYGAPMRMLPGVADRTPEEWAQEYGKRQFALQERLTDKLADLLAELLKGARIDYVNNIEQRTKTEQSLADKLRRKGESYQDPLAEVGDLSGLRVITYLPSDRVRVGELIEQEFVVDPERSPGESAPSDPARFGYESAHYVVAVTQDRAALTDWADFADLVAEIQVRTVLQHAWAAISHKVDYKTEAEVPPEVRRQLFRLSALLELADQEFQTIQEAAPEAEARAEDKVRAGDYAVGLSAAALVAYLEHSGIDRLWAARATDIGFHEPDPSAASDEEDRAQEDRAHVLLICTMANIETVSELDAVLHEDWAEPLLRDFFKRVVERGYTPVAHPPDVLIMVVLLAQFAPRTIVQRTMFLSVIQEALLDVTEKLLEADMRMESDSPGESN